MELTVQQEGLLAGLSDDWGNPYAVGDGRRPTWEQERWALGFRIGIELREIANERLAAQAKRAVEVDA